MNTTLVFDTLVEASGRALLVAGFVSIALTLFRAKAPALRHAVWTAALATMLTLPVMSAWLPTIQIPRWLPEPSLERMAASYGPVAIVLHAIPSSPVASSPTSTPIGAGLTPAPAAPTSRPRPWMTASTTAPPDWRVNAVLLWAMVAGALLLREAMGRRLAQRLAAQGVPAAIGDGTYESDRVSTPVVTGVVRPRVLVPSSWSQWGSGVRQMVLTHERAHVTRRDPLVAALARLNRSIFWFHPLAWWLERHLSRLAERACDEAVVRELKDSRLYAALLVEMAHRLQQHGQRVAWQGIGIVSSRRFEDRLDQILKGPTPDLSRRSKVALTAVCGLFVAAGIACGTAAAPLAEDPNVAREIAASQASFADYDAAQTLTLEQVDALEKAVATNPDDISATAKLLVFYEQRGQKLLGWDRMLAARGSHIRRMIAGHPESHLARWPYPRSVDPVGYEKARVLWMEHIEGDVTLEMLSNAAMFFERSEKPLAVQLLLRAQTADPNGPMPRVSTSGVQRLTWSRRLGAIYAMAIVGSDDQTMWDPVVSVNAELAQGVFAKGAREKLEVSNDAQLLHGAGAYLMRKASAAKVDFDPRALGLTYVTRALKLDPSSLEAQQILRGPGNAELMLKRLGKPPYQLSDAEFEKLPIATQLEYARPFLWAPYGLARTSHQAGNLEAADAFFGQLKRRAEALQRSVDHPAGAAVPAALQANLHIAFGTVAMHRGDRREAVRRLGLAASAVPAASDIGDSGLGFHADKLTYDLLDAGERESAAAYFDAIAKSVDSAWRSTYEDAATAIREGRMPVEYQRYRAGLR